MTGAGAARLWLPLLLLLSEQLLPERDLAVVGLLRLDAQLFARRELANEGLPIDLRLRLP